MAFGATSAIFNSWVRDCLSRTASFVGDIDVATFNVALFNDTTTPDNTVAAPAAAYNGGVWVTGNERTDATNWQAKGRPLGTVTLSAATGINYTMMDATDTAGAGNVTLSLVFGDLVYDDALSTPVVDQALCYHSYGGSAQGVTAGTFTVVWHANGVARWTHTPA
jgi:hypothetical protein